MIISLRGTSGSGKSHLVREVVACYGRHRHWYEAKRKRPLYSVHGRNPDGRCVVTPGHYEIGNGGVDTLPDLETAYRIARWGDAQHFDVLMEGKNMSDGTRHVDGLMAEQRDVRVVHIDIPVEECIASVRARGHKISEASIRKTDAKVRRDMGRMTCKTFSGSREQCLDQVLKWLGLSSSE